MREQQGRKQHRDAPGAGESRRRWEISQGEGPHSEQDEWRERALELGVQGTCSVVTCQNVSRPLKTGPLLNPCLDLNQHPRFRIYFRVLVLNHCYIFSSTTNPMYCTSMCFIYSVYTVYIRYIINSCLHTRTHTQMHTFSITVSPSLRFVVKKTNMIHA